MGGTILNETFNRGVSHSRRHVKQDKTRNGASATINPRGWKKTIEQGWMARLSIMVLALSIRHYFSQCLTQVIFERSERCPVHNISQRALNNLSSCCIGVTPQYIVSGSCRNT